VNAGCDLEDAQSEGDGVHARKVIAEEPYDERCVEALDDLVGDPGGGDIGGRELGTQAWTELGDRGDRSGGGNGQREVGIVVGSDRAGQRVEQRVGRGAEIVPHRRCRRQGPAERLYERDRALLGRRLCERIEGGREPANGDVERSHQPGSVTAFTRGTICKWRADERRSASRNVE